MSLVTTSQAELLDNLLTLFKVNGQAANTMLSAGQKEIVATIVFKLNPRVACLAPTGYGKDEAVSIGVITRVIFLNEPFIIASVKFGTSEIIMRMVIGHLFDNDIFLQALEIDKGTDFDKLRRDRNKTSLSFKGGGTLRVISLHGSETNLGIAIGEHEPNIVLDESPLLTPIKYLQLKKILEGTGSYEQTFLFELGNALNRNHFMENIKQNPAYLKLVVSLEQAIAEGRLDPQLVDENRTMPMFSEFYECKFPEEDYIDEKGYRVLLTSEEIEQAFTDELYLIPTLTSLSNLKLGVDIGGGGDLNVYTLRSPDKAWIAGSNKSNDTMTNVTEVEQIMTNFNVKDEDVYIDDTGIGRGVCDRLKERGHAVNAISFGSAPRDKSKYSNCKAEAFWLASVWIKSQGKLVRDANFYQLTWIKYKVNSEKVISIEPKAELKNRSGKSPDFADSLALTFARNEPRPGIMVV